MTNIKKKYFEQLLGCKKAYLNENEYKIYHTLFLSTLPSEAEMFCVFRGRNFITQREADELIQKKLINLEQSYAVVIFRCFDIEGKGYIDLSDLRRGWASVTPNLSWEVVESCFTDLVPQGVLSFDLFKRLYGDCSKI